VNTRAPSRRYDSVQQDWRGFLPDAKYSLYERHTRELENYYLMLSVTLNEILGRYRRGSFHLLCPEMGVLSDLCSRFVVRINALNHTMFQNARHFGVVPNLAPLDALNFATEFAQRLARRNELLSHILLSERSQFLHKLNSLQLIADQLGDQFIGAVQSVGHDGHPDPDVLFASLDSAHYDLNTCLRESIVLFKSFLFVLPEAELDRFDFTICGLARDRRPGISPERHTILSRRTSVAAGK
jgi:hypothetical protein